MQKHELIGLTLQRLIHHFRESPESFDFMDCTTGNMGGHTFPTITFRPKIQLSDHQSTLIQDPNNEHAVVVVFNSHLNEMACYIFMKAPSTLSNMMADSTVISGRLFEKWRGNYKKFSKLRELIQDRDQFKANMAYLKKLSSVFPHTMDDHLL
jgi:hypothetical protein